MAAADGLERCRTLLHRRRRDAEPGRLAERRRHPARAAERPPAICDHVVFPGGGVNRNLCPLSSPQRGLGMNAYQQLEARFRRIGTIEQAISVLNWDAAAMMPAGGGAARAEQLATLRVIAHQEVTDPAIERAGRRGRDRTRGARSLAAGQSARDPPAPGARHGNPGGSRRGPVPRLFRLRGGMAQRPRRERFQRRCCRGSSRCCG